MTDSNKADLFRHAMSRFTSAINIITTRDGADPAGLIATSVCSLSAEPPSILVCINKSASAHDMIINSKVFAVNLLAANQKAVAQCFYSAKGAQRFATIKWQFGINGAPILHDSLVALECKVTEAIDGYSHSIFIGEITESILHDDPLASCLLWHQREFASIAMPSR